MRIDPKTKLWITPSPLDNKESALAEALYDLLYFKHPDHLWEAKLVLQKYGYIDENENFVYE